MDNQNLNGALAGAQKGISGGIWGIAGGAVVGAIGSSLGKKPAPPPPFYTRPIFWEAVGIVGVIVFLVVLNKRK
jgi:hypothetical protein